MSNKIIVLNDECRICSTTDLAFGYPGQENVFDFPEDFDYGRQFDYKIIDGALVYDPMPEPEAAPAQEERIKALEEGLASLTEGLEKILGMLEG